MGPVMVVGAYYVQIESWDWQPFVASLPIAFLVTGILQANNLRDIEVDRRTGKRTIATLIGRTWANREMYALLAGTYISLIVAVIVGAIPWQGLIALATVPLVRPIVQVIRPAVTQRSSTWRYFGPPSCTCSSGRSSRWASGSAGSWHRSRD